MTITLKAFLCIVSGALLGFAHPPFETGILGVAGFVPLLVLLSGAESAGSVFRRSYATFFLFNLISLYWPGGFVHGKDAYLMVSGALLLLAHPLFMTIPMLVLHAIRQSVGEIKSVALFPFIWVAFEFVHASTQLSFPWLSLGYTQSYDLDAIQWASVTGVYGISFWIASLNVVLYLIFAFVIARPGEYGGTPVRVLVLAAIVLYAAPYVAARWMEPSTRNADDGGRRLAAAVIQPDIDPFEKWSGAASSQVALLRHVTDSTLDSWKPDVIIWPETAVPFYLLSAPRAGAFDSLREYVTRTGVPLLTGVPDIVLYTPPREAPRGAKTMPDGTRYETFNSSILLLPGVDTVQKYAKTLLVPFAERVPYSDMFGFLNVAQWNFGLGGWSMGRDTALFRLPLAGGDTARFGNLICYESVYPGYVADLVRRGARFLTVITNDSWWGNTAGPYQHRQFAVLRAVENRRWIIQCANGGISFVVDPVGRIVTETEMFTRTALRAEIGLPVELSPYARYGDWFAEGCFLLTVFAFAASVFHRIFRLIFRRRMKA